MKKHITKAVLHAFFALAFLIGGFHSSALKVYAVDGAVLSFRMEGGSYEGETDHVVIPADHVDSEGNYWRYDSLPTPTREGYTFAGWFFDDNDKSQLVAGQDFYGRDKYTVYAHWTKNEDAKPEPEPSKEPTPSAKPEPKPTTEPEPEPEEEEEDDEPAGTPVPEHFVVTCQDAGFPANYSWNEAAQACQPGYIDDNGVFHAEEPAPTPAPVQPVITPAPTAAPTPAPTAEPKPSAEPQPTAAPESTPEASKKTYPNLTPEEAVTHSNKATVKDCRFYNTGKSGNIYSDEDALTVQRLVLEKLNAQRKEAGAPELTLNSDLDSATWANIMISTGLFEHADLRGKYGVMESFNKGGENIFAIWGDLSPEKLAESATTAWNNSPGHYKNRMNPAYKYYDFTIVRGDNGVYYAVERFGDR